MGYENRWKKWVSSERILSLRWIDASMFHSKHHEILSKKICAGEFIYSRRYFAKNMAPERIFFIVCVSQKSKQAMFPLLIFNHETRGGWNYLNKIEAWWKLKTSSAPKLFKVQHQPDADSNAKSSTKQNAPLHMQVLREQSTKVTWLGVKHNREKAWKLVFMLNHINSPFKSYLNHIKHQVATRLEDKVNHQLRDSQDQPQYF